MSRFVFHLSIAKVIYVSLRQGAIFLATIDSVDRENKIYFVCYILCVIFCVLYSTHYILCGIFCTLYSACFILCVKFCAWLSVVVREMFAGAAQTLECGRVMQLRVIRSFTDSNKTPSLDQRCHIVILVK